MANPAEIIERPTLSVTVAERAVCRLECSVVSAPSSLARAGASASTARQHEHRVGCPNVLRYVGAGRRLPEGAQRLCQRLPASEHAGEEIPVARDPVQHRVHRERRRIEP